MKKFMMLVVALLLVAGIWHYATSQDLTKEGKYYKTTIHKTFDVNPGGTLNIENVESDIQITTWDKNRVYIQERLALNVYTQEEAKERVSQKEKNYKQNGNNVTITGTDGWDNEGSDFEIKVPRKYNLNLNTKSGDVVISGLEGNIEARTSGGDIEVSEITGVVRVSTSGGDMSFKGISGSLTANTSGGDIELFNILCECTVNTSGGDITLEKATQRVSLQTSGGDVEASNVEGSLSIGTSGGDVVVSNCSGEQVALHTSGGEIEMINIKGRINANTSGGDIDGRTFYKPVEVKTSGGDIEILDVQSSLTAQTSGGDVVAEITLKDFSQPHSVELETSGGDIDLTLPANIPASINAEIRLNRSGRDWERYDIYSDFPLTKTKPGEFGDRTLQSTGDINGGGDPIILKTKNGNITIHKAN
ncbi:MAG TPA: DUF4097 family beta strand repeat-containing protein [bacterium]|nr:DUF4097 family beta strand repeat-containing protein [bacterium]HPN44559.1 DUF4097 family beta strand repeat-containing protein [bacterium]